MGSRWPVNGQYPVAFSGTQLITKKRTPGKEIKRFKVVCVCRTRRQAVGAESWIDLGEAFGSDRIAEWIKNKECKHQTVVRALDCQSRVAWISDHQIAGDFQEAVRINSSRKFELHLDGGTFGPIGIPGCANRVSNNGKQRCQNGEHEFGDA